MATGNQVKAVIPAPKAGEGTEDETRAGQSRASTPSPIWSAHETGWQRRSAESTTSAATIPKGAARA
jgi:hypothetical protein